MLLLASASRLSTVKQASARHRLNFSYQPRQRPRPRRRLQQRPQPLLAAKIANTALLAHAGTLASKCVPQRKTAANALIRSKNAPTPTSGQQRWQQLRAQLHLRPHLVLFTRGRKGVSALHLVRASTRRHRQAFRLCALMQTWPTPSMSLTMDAQRIINGMCLQAHLRQQVHQRARLRLDCAPAAALIPRGRANED